MIDFADIAEDQALSISNQIPIKNIWLLMFFASEISQIDPAAGFDYENPPARIFDFVSKLLITTVERRIHKNLTLGFSRTSRELSRVRGRIDCLKTERKSLLSKGRIACTYEILSVDTALNRYVLSALLKASRLCSRDVAVSCRRLSTSLKEMGVMDAQITNQLAQVSQYGYMNPGDKLMISAAKLIHQMILPTELSGNLNIQNPDRNVHWLRQLFEKAVGGFYKVYLDPKVWRVSQGPWLKWNIGKKSAGLSRIFPEMKADIVLFDQTANRRIIVDTKFTSVLRKGYLRESTLRSGYIYQMYSYIFSQADGPHTMNNRIEGILLHPAIGFELDECVEIQGKLMRFSTVDLSSDTQSIMERLLFLVKEFPFDTQQF
jgi:5-methylcytosine-specific restriction enzyme subunit McrC